MVSQAIEQLTREGCVKTEQLKAVTTHLELRNGLLYFGERLVVPKNTQGKILPMFMQLDILERLGLYNY